MKNEGNEWKEVSKQLLVKIYFCALGKFIKKKTEVSHDITKKKNINKKWNKNIYLDFHIRENRIVSHISLLKYLLVIRFAGALFITLAYKVFRPQQLNLANLFLFSVCVIEGNLKSKKNQPQLECNIYF